MWFNCLMLSYFSFYLWRHPGLGFVFLEKATITAAFHYLINQSPNYLIDRQQLPRILNRCLRRFLSTYHLGDLLYSFLF
jgi:hypothetical protein